MNRLTENDIIDVLAISIVTLHGNKLLTKITKMAADLLDYKEVLEIIFEKRVNFEVFGAFETYEDYEIYYNKKVHLIEQKLTEEEFYSLKRMGGE